MKETIADCTAIDVKTYDPGTKLQMMHISHQLLFIIQGKAAICYGPAATEFSTGQLIFVKRQVQLDLQVMGDEPLQLITCAIGEDLLQEFSKKISLPAGTPDVEPVSIHEAATQINVYFLTLMYYFPDRTNMDPWLINLKLQELLYCISRHHTGLLRQLMHWKPTVYADIMSVVNNHIDTGLSLAALARLSGRSLSSFKRDFFAVTSMAPAKWIRQKKLEKARELMSSTDLSVSDVCYTLGFENVTHFSKIFKVQYGVAPMVSRKGV
ncbi:helix-turn-helix domain-containing protein [Chitinophaga sp. sic0106]|uniref:helix-turn-helix domain-containing protein n=1 Tax=Chitinophaga sp. sic0106 TaxID=2854785 RepID=UPI001C47AA80|nr:AraC family transcriptional regulator [Chitinophaga sp. sic0106]MBV7532130.1 AraC family transcriptional regulator [Chitinophaga sp. sic0106]